MSRALHKDRTVRFFGEKLRALRLKHKLTLKELANKLGYVGHGYISEIESGKKAPTVELTLKVAEVFEVTADQLLKDNIKLSERS